MAKEKGKFGTKIGQQIDVRVTSLPGGVTDATDAIKDLLETFKNSISGATAAFMVGKASDGKTDKILQAKVQSQKKSILGDQNSIYKLLTDIKSNTASQIKQSQNYLKLVTDKITSINDKLPDLNSIVDDGKNISVNIAKDTIDVEKIIKDIIQDNNNDIQTSIESIKESYDKFIKSYDERLNTQLEENVKLYDINTKLRDDVIKEIHSSKLYVVVKGLEKTNLDDIIKFSSMNTDQFNSNIESIDKFFIALKSLESLNIKDSSLNILPILNDIGITVEKLVDISNKFTSDKIASIIPLFSKEGQLATIIKSINSLPKVKKGKDEEVKNSVITLGSILISLSNMLTESQKSLNNIKNEIDSFKDLEKLFENGYTTIIKIFGGSNSEKGIINEIVSSLNNLEVLKDNRVKEIGKSLVGVSGIFGETLLMMTMFWPMFLLYNKTIGNIDYTKIFKNLGNMMAAVADINLPPENKIEDIKKDIKGIRSIFKSLYIMNLMALGFVKKDKGNFNRTNNIFNDIKELFKTINKINNTEAAIKHLNNIKTGILNINETLSLIRLMEIEKQVNKIGSFESLNNLLNGEQGIYELFKKINNIKNDKIAAERIDNILHVFTKIDNILNTIKKTKISKNTEKTLESIYNLFNDQSKKQTLQKSLKGIFESIKFMQLPDKDKLAKVANLTLDMGNIINLFDEISKKNIDCEKVTKMFDDYIKTIEEIYKKIDERFDNIIQTSNKVDQIREANKKIKEGLDDCTEMAVTTGSKETDIKSGNISLQGLTDFMISAAVVMSIGALFMMLGGGKFAAAALEFGATLMVFEILVLTPVLVFSKQQTEVMKSINNMNGFIITCTVTLLIGALFMTLGGGNYVKNALAFGIVLSIFEFLVVAPFLAFYNHKSNVMKGLNEFSTFLFTCTIIMSIGALIMGHANGKFIKNALKFGLVLGLFEALVVAPFILFGLIKGEVFENADKFIGIVITCTTILLIGALFMSIKNGALVKGAIKFAATLMLFEMMVIAPFLLMNLLKDRVFSGMKLFSGIIISSTIILMIGALFMTVSGGKYVKEALLFTGLLMAFEVGVILPFLLFNFIKRQVDKGLIGFAAVIFVSTTILMIGALFMTLKNGEYAQGAIDFAKLLGLFIGGIGLIAVGLSKWLGNKEIMKMQEFGTFVLLSSISLMIGAYVVKNYGFWNTVGYAIILSGFVTIMASIALVVSAIVDNDAVKDMMAFGAFVMLSSLALITGAFFISQYGVDSVVQYAIILGLFTGAMSIVALIVGKAINEKGIAAMTMLGTFLLLASGSLIIGATYIKEYGCDSALKFMGLLALYVIGAVGVFALLEFLTPFIIVGIATGALLGVALLTLTTSLMLVNTLFLLDPEGKNLTKNLKALNNVIGDGLWWTFTYLGALSFLIIPGSLAAAAMGVSLLILGGSLTLVNIIMEHGKEIGNSIDTLNGILSFNLMFTYSILGLLYPLIIPGSISAAAIGVSMLILGASLKATHNIVKDIGEEAIKKDIDILSDAVQGIGGLSVVMVALIIPLTLGLIGLALFDDFSKTTSTAIISMTNSINLMKKSGDMTKDIDLAVKNLKSFIEIPKKVFKDINLIDIWKLIGDIDNIKQIAKPMGDVMISSANAVQSMASLKVPSDWDEKGNPIKYRQLGKNDFDLAVSNTSTLLGLMAQTFGIVWNGGKFKIGDHDITIDQNKSLSVLYQQNDKAIQNIVDFGIKSGTLIKGLSEGIANIAKLQIPIAWNENGNPIGYRQLNTSDFTKAAAGVQIILSNIAQSILDTYNTVGGEFEKFNGGKNIFDDMDEDGIFMRTFTASFKMSELIGSVGKAVGDIAKMQIPIAWDPKTGNVTQYETLTTKHFTDMGTGISTILGAVFQAIAGLYTADWALDGDKNIFDAVASDTWYAGILGSKDPSPFEKVLGFSFKVSELIANVGKNIKDLALLQIPKYGKKGKDLAIIGYEKLTPTDFQQMGENVGKILTATLLAIGKIKVKDEGALKTTLEALTPVSQLISDSADGIVKLASGQVPVLDEKTGKVISYKLIGKNEYGAAETAIKTIMTAIPNALTENNEIKSVFKDEKFKDIMEGISSTSGLITSIADSIVKLGSAQIPDVWDPKTGKPTHYKNINIKDTTENLKTVLGELIFSVSQSIIDIWFLGKDQGLFDENINGGNSKFAVAVKGILDVSKVISIITDSIVKLGTAQIPTKWDEKGNPTWYKTINPMKVVKDIKEIFNGSPGNEGILTVLSSIITTASNTFEKQHTSELAQKLQPSINTITKLIGSVSETIVNMASLKIPTGFDKDGNETGYIKLNTKDIDKAKDNVVAIITALLSIPNEVDTNLQNKGINLKETVGTWKTDTISYLNTIGDVVDTLNKKIDTITHLDDVNNYANILNTIINQFDSTGDTIYNSIDKLKTNIEKLKQIFTDGEDNMYVSSVTNDSLLKKISNYLTAFIQVLETYDIKTNIKGNQLVNLSQSLYNNFSKQKPYSQAFDNNTKKLSNYIKTVNSINVANANALASFVNSLNNFANKFGNLDQLTDAIANKLVLVLNDLIDKLEESKDTINKADKIQQDRQKLIDASIKEVRELIENPINIKVSSDTTDNGDDGMPSSEGSSSSTPQGGQTSSGDTGGGQPSRTTSVSQTNPSQDQSRNSQGVTETNN